MKRDLKVMYCSYQPYSIELGKKLRALYNWQPVYWFTNPAAHDVIRSEFPGVICHNYIRAIRGIPPEGVPEHTRAALDEGLLTDMAYHESIALNMMERNDSMDSFKYRERIALYHYHLEYWSGILDMLKPAVIVFEEEPHQAVDYVLYQLAVRRKIETVMFIRTSFLGRMFPVKRFEEGSETIRLAYEAKLAPGQHARKPFAPDITAFLDKLAGNYDEVRKMQLYDQVERIDELQSASRPGLPAMLLGAAARFLKLFNPLKLRKRVRAIADGFMPDIGSSQKVPGKKFSESWFTKHETNANTGHTLQVKEALREYYEKHAIQAIDLKSKFIICALSYQPEKTTSPMGGHFANQLLMVKLLRRAMPADWNLYVKDHISQFAWYAQFGEQHRSSDFYDAIRELPNTFLVPLFYDTFSLVDNCKAVATVTGSIGFEAIMRNKPVLTFGHPWYKFCEGAFYSGNYPELKTQIEMINAGYTPDHRKAELFIETIQEQAFEGVVGGRNIVAQAGERGEPTRNADAHLKALESILQ